MTTRRKPDQQRGGKSAARRPELEDEDLALAEELLRGAREEQAAAVAEMKKFLKQLGIRAKPIGAEKLREMAIREGLDPEGTQFSRGIIKMCEE